MIGAEPRIRVSALLRWGEGILLCRHDKRGRDVWLLPGGGGTKELLFRFTEELQPYGEADPFEAVKRAFQLIAAGDIETEMIQANACLVEPVTSRSTTRIGTRPERQTDGAIAE